MKNFKRKVIVGLSVIALLMSSGSSFASSEKLKEVPKVEVESTAEDNNVGNATPSNTPSYRYSKKNVKYSEYWGPWVRISNNITVGSKGGSITANVSKTFTTTINGSIQGIGAIKSKSVTSSKGYKLNATPNTTSYLAFRVHYKKEAGTRIVTDTGAGRVVSTNSYSKTVPMYGEYKLIRVK